MTFRLSPTTSGSLLGCRAFLHAEDQIACLTASAGPQILRAGQPQTVELVFDQAGDGGRCRPPFELTHLAFVAEGTVAGRQGGRCGIDWNL